MKLNLGSGSLTLEDYENIDIKDGRVAYPLDVADESCDEIRASHILEHFDNRHVFEVVKNWAAKLKVGGVMKIAVPDLRKITTDYVNHKPINISGYLMGGQSDENDYHKSLYDKELLTSLLQSAGMTDIKEWTSEIQDCAALPISLNLQGTKVLNTVQRKVVAVMSMPRLSFTDHMTCLMTEIVAHGINVKMGTGVFWSQILSRGIESALEENPDYILTIDYDTWFKYGHLQRLLAIMETNPHVDALCPVQMKRECDSPMMGLLGPDGERLTKVDYSELEKDILPIATGHFGLTVFKASSFAKLKHPWFLGQPGPDGKWNDGRIDDDIYFWKNFIDSGNKAYIANKVQVGHIQLLCTFPGHYTDNFKCVHTPLGELGQVDKIPEHCRW